MAINSIELNKKLIFDSSKVDGDHIEVAANPYNRVEVISNIDDFLALREQWNAINDHTQNGNVFISWEWLYTWWETYQKQGDRSLYILSCTNIHNELLGIAPFQIVNNPKRYFPCSRQLLMLGTGETDGSLVFGEYMDLLIKQGHGTAVTRALSDYLYQHNNLWDGLKFQQQLAGSHIEKLFQNHLFEDLAMSDKSFLSSNKLVKKISDDGFRTYIDLPESYKDYLMSLRKKMRNNITRTYSRLESEQTFSIESVTTDSEIKAEMAGQKSGIQTLAELNITRRGNMDEISVFAQPNFVLFHRRLLKRLLPLNKVSLRILHFDKEPVAALYSFVDSDTVHAYQSGFETKNGHRYSLLTTMLTQEISKSIEITDIARFNFMYSSDENTYKRRYSGTTEKMYNISYDKGGLKYSVYRFIHGPLKSLIKKRLKTT